MGVTPLAAVLDGKVANAIAAEGLLPYFPREKQVQICRQVYDNLATPGLFVADMSWHEGVRQAREGTRFFSRQAGDILGIVTSADEARSIFTEAGFQKVVVHLPSDLAPRYNLPTPVLNFQLLVAAYKGAAAAQ
jgi:O-methyltransferase involved in polyketide biosynthesis